MTQAIIFTNDNGGVFEKQRLRDVTKLVDSVNSLDELRNIKA
jgi:hypothetical protein